MAQEEGWFKHSSSSLAERERERRERERDRARERERENWREGRTDGGRDGWMDRLVVREIL